MSLHSVVRWITVLVNLETLRHFLAPVDSIGGELVCGYSNFLVKADFFIFPSSNMMYSHSAETLRHFLPHTPPKGGRVDIRKKWGQPRFLIFRFYWLNMFSGEVWACSDHSPPRWSPPKGWGRGDIRKKWGQPRFFIFCSYWWNMVSDEVLACSDHSPPR